MATIAAVKARKIIANNEPAPVVALAFRIGDLRTEREYSRSTLGCGMMDIYDKLKSRLGGFRPFVGDTTIYDKMVS